MFQRSFRKNIRSVFYMTIIVNMNCLNNGKFYNLDITRFFEKNTDANLRNKGANLIKHKKINDTLRRQK